MNTQERLDKILNKVKDPHFINKMGHGNELGFFVFDYPPQDELMVRTHLDYLERQLTQTPNLKVVFLDLYEAILSLLEKRRVLEKLPHMEAAEGTEKLVEKLIRGPLRPENFTQHLLELIPEEAQLIFLSGVGKAWPILRSHTILNNLHHPLNDRTVILFFPGKYDQKELSLFGLLKDDNYYRAFQLVGDRS
jgi:L-fucose mutarotase/ribose pyranase (RbsD/FucU family)